MILQGHIWRQCRSSHLPKDDISKWEARYSFYTFFTTTKAPLESLVNSSQTKLNQSPVSLLWLPLHQFRWAKLLEFSPNLDDLSRQSIMDVFNLTLRHDWHFVYYRSPVKPQVDKNVPWISMFICTNRLHTFCFELYVKSLHKSGKNSLKFTWTSLSLKSHACSWKSLELVSPTLTEGLRNKSNSRLRSFYVVSIFSLSVQKSQWGNLCLRSGVKQGSNVEWCKQKQKKVFSVLEHFPLAVFFSFFFLFFWKIIFFPWRIKQLGGCCLRYAVAVRLG